MGVYLVEVWVVEGCSDGVLVTSDGHVVGSLRRCHSQFQLCYECITH